MSRPRMPLRACFPPAPPPGRAGDPGATVPGGPYQHLMGDRIVLLGGPAAILLQIAHPLVGAGVTEHSDYRSRPGHRLTATLQAALTVAFGDAEQARAAAAAVGRRHSAVRGTLPAPVGSFAAGTPYDARDPELALWVYATLVHTALRVHQRYGRAPTGTAREEYYRQSWPFARAFGVPAGLLPPTWEDFRRYWDGAVAGLAVAPAVLDVARDILQPRLAPPVPGAGPLLRAVTADLLPEPVRVAYGLPLGGAQRAQVRALAAGARTLWPHAPQRLREFAHVRRYRQRLAAGR